MPVEDKRNEWSKDPFKLTGLNGYLYGRGASDNKGPIVSCLVAVHELFKQGLLTVNVIFLIEGEEECGSSGFLEALTNHHSLFQDIDLILLSNSYWLGEDTPCITYGLRGVVRADITVSSGLPNLHSGVEGGAISEPLIDLVHVIGKLVDGERRVLIPGKMGHLTQVLHADLCFFMSDRLLSRRLAYYAFRRAIIRAHYRLDTVVRKQQHL